MCVIALLLIVVHRVRCQFRCWCPAVTYGGPKIHPIDKSLHRVSIRTLLEASATGHHLWTIQTIVENVYVWLVGPRRRVSER